MNATEIAVNPNPVAITSPTDFLPLGEWSIFAVIAVFLIRNLLATDKQLRETNEKLTEKLMDKTLEKI